MLNVSAKQKVALILALVASTMQKLVSIVKRSTSGPQKYQSASVLIILNFFTDAKTT